MSPTSRRGLLVSLGTLSVVLVVASVGELVAGVVSPPTAAESHEAESVRFMLRHQQRCVTIENHDGVDRYVPLTVEDDDIGHGQEKVGPPVKVARTPGVVRVAIVGESSAWLLGHQYRTHITNDRDVHAQVGRHAATRRCTCVHTRVAAGLYHPAIA